MRWTLTTLTIFALSLLGCARPPAGSNNPVDAGGGDLVVGPIVIPVLKLCDEISLVPPYVCFETPPKLEPGGRIRVSYDFGPGTDGGYLMVAPVNAPDTWEKGTYSVSERQQTNLSITVDASADLAHRICELRLVELPSIVGPDGHISFGRRIASRTAPFLVQASPIRLVVDAGRSHLVAGPDCQIAFHYEGAPNPSHSYLQTVNLYPQFAPEGNYDQRIAFTNVPLNVESGDGSLSCEAAARGSFSLRFFVDQERYTAAEAILNID